MSGIDERTNDRQRLPASQVDVHGAHAPDSALEPSMVTPQKGIGIEQVEPQSVVKHSEPLQSAKVKQSLEARRLELQRQKKQAVEEENYEEAANLREALKKLEAQLEQLPSASMAVEVGVPAEKTPSSPKVEPPAPKKPDEPQAPTSEAPAAKSKEVDGVDNSMADTRELCADITNQMETAKGIHKDAEKEAERKAAAEEAAQKIAAEDAAAVEAARKKAAEEAAAAEASRKKAEEEKAAADAAAAEAWFEAARKKAEDEKAAADAAAAEAAAAEAARKKAAEEAAAAEAARKKAAEEKAAADAAAAEAWFEAARKKVEEEKVAADAAAAQAAAAEAARKRAEEEKAVADAAAAAAEAARLKALEDEAPIANDAEAISPPFLEQVEPSSQKVVPPPPPKPTRECSSSVPDSEGMPASSTPPTPPPPPRSATSQVATSQGAPAPSTPKPPPSSRQAQAIEGSPRSPKPESGQQLARQGKSPASEASAKFKSRSESSESNQSSESAQGESSCAASHWAPSPMHDLSPKCPKQHTTEAAKAKSMVAKGPRTGSRTGPRCSLLWVPPRPPSPPKRSASEPLQRAASVSPNSPETPARERSRSARSRSNRRMKSKIWEGSFRVRGRTVAPGKRIRSASRPHQGRKIEQFISSPDSTENTEKAFISTWHEDRSKGGKAKGKGKSKGKSKGGRGERQSRSRSRILRRRRRTSRNGRRRQRTSSTSGSPSVSSQSPARSASACRARSRSARRARSSRGSTRGFDGQATRTRTRSSNNLAASVPARPPRMDEALWCFRHFCWTQVADLASPAAAVQQYREYENSYRQYHAAAYFSQHKTDGIIRELYDPSFLDRMFELQLTTARSAAEEFIKEVQAGAYRELTMTYVGKIDDSSPAGQDQLVRKCEIAGHGSAPYFPFDPDVCTLSFDRVPSALSVWQFRQILQHCKGFLAVWLTPSKLGVSERVGHARFQSSDDLEEALTKLSGLSVDNSGYVLQPKRARPHSSHSVDVVPAIMSEPERVEKDLSLAAELMSAWNASKAVPQNCQEAIQNVFASIEGSVGKLDLSILYLRRVHNICFYSGTACSNERELAESCGVVRLRLPARVKQDVQLTGGLSEEAKWAAEHETRIQQLLQKGHQLKRPEICSLEEEPLRSRWAKQCEEDTLKVDEAKFRCTRCQKLFRGPEFVQKHLFKFHPELLQKLVDDINEERTREAFLADTDAVTSVPLPTFPASAPGAAAARTIPTPVRQLRSGWDQ